MVLNNVGRTFATVDVRLHGTGDGLVQYAVMNVVSGSLFVATALAALQQGQDYTVRIDGQRPARVNVTGLLPSTDYDLFCSAVGISTQLPSIIATMRSLHTACCKTITVTVEHPRTVGVGQELAGGLTVTLDAPPRVSIVVTLGYGVGDQESSEMRVQPSVLHYDNRSVSGGSRDIGLTALTAGNYTLLVSVTGPSAEEYQVVYVGTAGISVLSTGALPVAPHTQHAAFSNDGSHVTLSFDAATNRGGQYGTFPCSVLLRFAGASSAYCYWYSDHQLRIQPVATGAGTILGVGGNITLLPNVVTAKCTDYARAAGRCASYSHTPSGTVLVSAPIAPTAPAVVISAPSAIGGCNSLTLDFTSSLGAARRPWEGVSFEVYTTPVSVSAANRLLQFLTRNYTVSPPSPVPSTVLVGGLTYSIKVTLCNFLKACGSATKVVSVAENTTTAPVVTIAGRATKVVYRTDILSVAAEAYTESCVDGLSGGKSSTGLQYSWVIAQNLPAAATHHNATLRSVSQNPAVFKLPAYALSVGITYTLTVSATSAVSALQSSAAVQVKVLQADLAAVLRGGSTRYSMVGEVITMDASSSYDKDYPQQPLSLTAVVYTWQCMTVAPVISSQCAVTMADAYPGRSDVINVTSAYITLNTTTVITVTVSDARRSSTAQVRIIILQAPSPRLSITAAGSADNVNTGMPFTLLGSVQALVPCAAAWSVNIPSIAIASVARTPVRQYVQPDTGATAVPFNLVIRSDALPQRATLQFTLSCGTAAVSTTVTTNGSPLPGSFSVTPVSGTEVYTTFTFSAAQWSDPDLPLTYQFGFQSAVSLNKLVIVSRSELTYATSSLPAGDVTRDGAVDCSLRIFDGIGAFTDNTAVATVTAPTTEDQSAQLVLELLKGAVGSVQAAKIALAVGSSVLNAVNCTAAPECAPLNRHPCRMTSGQCGACLDGFVGDAGDRNTLCVALTAPPAQLAVTKTCEYNCTGHGQCIFVSKITGAPVTKCALADTECDAMCSCTNHYSGEFCEMDPVTLRRRREVRSKLILSLHNLTREEDINTESVASWSANLYALSIRPHEVSQSDATIIADIANTTLRNAMSLGVESYADMLGVLQATDLVASLQRYNYNPNDYRDADFNTSRSYVSNTAARFIPVVSTFGDMVSSIMVLGENETTLVYENFRMAVALAAGRRIEEIHHVPVEEQQDAAVASSVALQTVPDAVTPTVAIKVLSTYPRSYTPDTADYLSSPVRLQVTALNQQHSKAEEYLSTIVFRLHHNAPQAQFTYDQGRNFSSVCGVVNASQTFTYRCAGSEHVIRHNCSQGTGVHVSYCPRPAAACSMLTLETAELSTLDTCSVENATATYTTCRCVVRSSGVRKRRLVTTTEGRILDNTGATNMLATTTYIASDFAGTFTAAGDVGDASFASVLVVVVMLGAVWAVGLGVLVAERAFIRWKPGKVKISKERDCIQSTLTYIDSVVPRVFEKGASRVHRLMMEIAEHHVLFQLLTGDSYGERQFLMMQALTELTVLFFLTAEFFDLSQPDDDGTCPHHTIEATCLERTSPFDYEQTYCTWVESSGGANKNECIYNNQGMSIRALFYMTFLTTIISSIVSVPVDYLFGTLKATTATGVQIVDASAVVDTVTSSARRLSSAGLTFLGSARVAPAASSKSGSDKSRGSTSLQGSSGRTSNRVIPASIVEVSTAAQGSFDTIRRNASRLSLRAEGASSTLRSRSARMARTSHSTRQSSSSSVNNDGVLRVAESTTLTKEGSDKLGGALSLMQDIAHQRLLMNSAAKETKNYDTQWGVMSDADGNYIIRSDAADCIEAAVNESNAEALRLDAVINNYSLQHAGFEMLHLFMLDLLGRTTVAAKIFREKFKEEFGQSRVVVRWHKYAAAGALVALNAFFIYFVMIRGIQKGRDWQLQYITCCAVQVGVDILLFETVECAWLNFLVPQYVHDEVASAAEKLRSLTQKLAGSRTDIEDAQPELEVTKFFLNAPPHLFASVKLARMKPHLLESLIVGSYRHHLPGEICKTWPHCSGNEESRHSVATDAGTGLPLLRRVLRGLTLSLQLFISVPFVYQKVVLRFAQPVVFSGIALIFYTIFSSVVGWMAVFLVALCAVIYAVRRCRMASGRAGSAVASVADEDDVEEPTFIEDISVAKEWRTVGRAVRAIVKVPSRADSLRAAAAAVAEPTNTKQTAATNFTEAGCKSAAIATGGNGGCEFSDGSVARYPYHTAHRDEDTGSFKRDADGGAGKQPLVACKSFYDLSSDSSDDSERSLVRAVRNHYDLSSSDESDEEG
jgi:hypothetical protein